MLQVNINGQSHQFADVLTINQALRKIAVEVETGKSDIKENVLKLRTAEFDQILLIATSPAALAACQRVAATLSEEKGPTVEFLSWLDIS